MGLLFIDHDFAVLYEISTNMSEIYAAARYQLASPCVERIFSTRRLKTTCDFLTVKVFNEF